MAGLYTDIFPNAPATQQNISQDYASKAEGHAMWNRELNNESIYVIDFVEQGDDRHRIMLPRLVDEPHSEGTKYTSREYRGASLSEWLRSNRLSEEVIFQDGTTFKTGPHGEWITESEFNTWKEQMSQNSESLKN